MTRSDSGIRQAESRGEFSEVVATGVTGIAFSPDGTTLAQSRADGIASLWDLASARQIGAVKALGRLTSVHRVRGRRARVCHERL